MAHIEIGCSDVANRTARSALGPPCARRLRTELLVEPACAVAFEIAQQLRFANVSWCGDDQMNMVEHDRNRQELPSAITRGFLKLCEQFFSFVEIDAYWRTFETFPRRTFKLRHGFFVILTWHVVFDSGRCLLVSGTLIMDIRDGPASIAGEPLAIEC